MNTILVTSVFPMYSNRSSVKSSLPDICKGYTLSFFVMDNSASLICVETGLLIEVSASGGETNWYDVDENLQWGFQLVMTLQ